MTIKTKRLSYIEDTIKHRSILINTVKTAARKAIIRAKGENLFITYRDGDQIIREYGDGKKEVIGKIDSVPLKVKVGESIKLR